MLSCKKLIFLFLLPILCFAKVYDCFPFFNELELLQIRLDELDEVVDYFVLVESVETQRGKPKKLYFAENKNLFAPYLHKIIHVVIEEKHPEFAMWERENFQRNAILRGLVRCQEDDIILISDVDEIPRRYLIRHIQEEMRRRSIIAVAFQMKMYRYHLNRQASDYALWNGTVGTTYAHVREKNPQYFREKRDKYWHFKNAGWHFTWMGGKERVRQKLHSVVEGNDDPITDESAECLINSTPIVPIDGSFPNYVIEHEEELRACDFIAR